MFKNRLFRKKSLLLTIERSQGDSLCVIKLSDFQMK